MVLSKKENKLNLVHRKMPYVVYLQIKKTLMSKIREDEASKSENPE